MELFITEHTLAKNWISQFNTPHDRALASQLLSQLKFVSEREFESDIEKELIKLQKKLNKRIAVYPVIPSSPKGVVGYDLFTGGIPRNEEVTSREINRRRKYGSEDRVGHFVTKLQEQFKQANGVSNIECIPTVNQLKTQKIEHIVFIDDISGSGRRLADYWKNCVPKSIKSLLSFKRLELWIILYAITPMGRKSFKYSISNFPVDTHLITILPESNYKTVLDNEIITLSKTYAKFIGMESASLGYKDSGSLIVFEHGCPNNVPAIIWAKNKYWKGIFPNQGIPQELRVFFDEEGLTRSIESLWKNNQETLAINLLENIKQKNITSDESLMLIMLGLYLKKFSSKKIIEYLLITKEKEQELIKLALNFHFFDDKAETVTAFGKEFVKRYRKIYGNKKKEMIENSPSEYYPSQCDGKFRFSGKLLK